MCVNGWVVCAHVGVILRESGFEGKVGVHMRDVSSCWFYLKLMEWVLIVIMVWIVHLLMLIRHATADVGTEKEMWPILYRSYEFSDGFYNLYLKRE